MIDKKDFKSVFDRVNSSNRLVFQNCSTFLFLYWIAVFIYRCASKGLALGAIDMLWACNVSLLLAAIATRLRNNLMIDVCINVVALAHITWMIDVAAYVFIGSMPLGRATYMLWPDATLMHNFSTLHHGWYIPLLLYLLKRNGGTMQWRSVVYTFVVSLCLGLVSLLVPKTVNGVYLNINMAHEMWKDVSIDALHAYNPPHAHALLYLCYMLLVTNAFNLVFYAAVLCVFNFFPSQKNK